MSSLAFRCRRRRCGGILAIILIVIILSRLLGPFIRILLYPHSKYSALLAEAVRDLQNEGIPATVEDLNLSEIPDEKNGAVLFREIFSLVDELAGQYPDEWNYLPYVSPGEWANLPEEKRGRVVDLVLRDPGFLRIYELTERAVNMPQRFYPRKYYESSMMIEEKLFPEMVPEMAQFRGLQRVLLSKAKLEAEYGEVDEAFAAVLLSIKTARASSTDVPVILTQLVRLAMLQISLGLLDEIAGLDGVSAKSYRGIINQMEKEELLIYPALKNEIFLADVQQYTDIKRVTDPGKWARKSAESISPPDATEKQLKPVVASFEKIAEQTMEDIRNICPEVTYGDISVLRKYPEKLRLVSLRTRRKVMSIMKEPDYNALRELEKLERELKEHPSLENAIVLLWLHDILGICRQEVISRACLGAVKIGMANMLHKKEHSRYVDELCSLYPVFISFLPPDPFTGTDYIYRRREDGFIVYSVGPSGRDDGGVSDLGKNLDDIVWKTVWE